MKDYYDIMEISRYSPYINLKTISQIINQISS